MKKLPTNWYIEVTEENQAILDEWRKSVATRYLDHDLYVGNYVLSDSYDFSHYHTCNIKHSEVYCSYTEIDLETFLQITQFKSQIMKSYTIDYNQAQSIVDIACGEWKEKLFSKWGKNIVLKNYIEITESEYKIMRKACTFTQHELFDTIFGEDIPLKVGDWVKIIQSSSSCGDIFQLTKEHFEEVLRGYHIKYHIKYNGSSWSFPNQVRLATEDEIKLKDFPKEGTPCLVSDCGRQWYLRYSNGEGGFYADGKKEGMYVEWKYWRIIDLDGINLNIEN